MKVGLTGCDEFELHINNFRLSLLLDPLARSGRLKHALILTLIFVALCLSSCPFLLFLCFALFLSRSWALFMLWHFLMLSLSKELLLLLSKLSLRDVLC